MIVLVLSACSDVPTAKVQTEDVSLTVQASGELESKQTAIIAPPAVARMWQYQVKTLVPENSSVKKGQVVVSFDDKKLNERLFDKQGELSQASKELENKEMKEAEKEQELVLEVARMQMEFDKAKRKAEIVDSSRSENDRKKAQIDLKIAINDLKLAKKKLSFHRDNTQLNLKLAKGKVQRLTAEVNLIQSDLERLKVKAPIDGMVIYRANWQGEKPTVGETLNFGQPVMELAVLEAMQLKAQIDEPDSGKIAVGQVVKITIDASQEIVLSGKVEEMGRVFREKSHQDKRKVVDAIISLDDVDPKVVRPGLRARVEVVTETKKDVLTIPVKALHYEDGRDVVIVESITGTSEVEVEVETIVGNKAIIANGLAVSDEVVL